MRSHAYKAGSMDELRAEVFRLEGRVRQLEQERDKLREAKDRQKRKNRVLLRAREQAGVQLSDLGNRYRASEKRNAELERILANLQINLTQGGSPAAAEDNE